MTTLGGNCVLCALLLRGSASGLFRFSLGNVTALAADHPAEGDVQTGAPTVGTPIEHPDPLGGVRLASRADKDLPATRYPTGPGSFALFRVVGGPTADRAGGFVWGACLGQLPQHRGRVAPLLAGTVWEDARVPIDPESLRKSEVFSALSTEQLSKLAGAAQVTQHTPGETLTEEGAIGYRFYLLLEGSAVVERGGETLATIGAGDFVGEIALLGGGRSTATVRCADPTACLTIRREEFWAVLEAEPAIALRILEVVARRLERELRPDSRANLPGR